MTEETGETERVLVRLFLSVFIIELTFEGSEVNFRFMCDCASSFPRMNITWEGRIQRSKVKNIFIIPKMYFFIFTAVKKTIIN